MVRKVGVELVLDCYRTTQRVWVGLGMWALCVFVLSCVSCLHLVYERARWSVMVQSWSARCCRDQVDREE